MEIEVGSIYRLDQANLPTDQCSSIPPTLSCIRAVLVDQKSDDDVTVVFPSTESLRRFLRDEKPSGLMQPNLDEKFVMSLNMGEKLLAQKIPFEEFAAQRGTHSFWVLDSADHHDEDGDDHHHTPSTAGLVINWGTRRRATFSGKLRGDRRTSISPCAVVLGESAIANSLNEEAEDKEDEDEEDQDVDDDDNKQEFSGKHRTVKKRKCQFKEVNYTEKKKRKQAEGGSENGKKPMNLQHRWTSERYKLAEKNMLKIMKAKEAVPGNPILRPELRSEARKLIGDTGLLDHLLKHMAGKLAPGGKERFRRRHNPEGAMEYWLESADLIEIRKQAGIKDPYWVPPPGWKPGDSPTQDPVCARELKALKEEVANMKREMERLACREQAHNDQALMAIPAETAEQTFGRLNCEGSLIKPFKEMYEALMKKKAFVEKQLSDISKSLSGMEEEIGRAKGLTSSSEAVSEVADDEKWTKGLTEGDKDKQRAGSCKRNGAFNEAATSQEQPLQIPTPKQKQPQNPQNDKAPPPLPPSPPAANTADDQRMREKQERRQRLKSGFRICKPQGTFLWPNQVMLHFDGHDQDILARVGYPTPPSVSSSSSSYCRASPLVFPTPDDHHMHHHRDLAEPPGVIKRPVAKRATVTLNISTTTIRGSTTIESISSPTTTTASCSSTNTTYAHQIFVPDLNEAPPPSIISSFT